MSQIMTKEEFNASLINDPLNEKGGRNRRNSPQKSYNCGGFALSVYDWICPYNTKRCSNDPWNETKRVQYIEDNLEIGVPLDEITNEVLDKDAYYLLIHYPFLRRVDLSECHRDDTIIAYRIFITSYRNQLNDTDFHFRVYHHGYWFEKMGCGEITIATGKLEEPWYSDEETIYDSRIIYFKSTREFI